MPLPQLPWYKSLEKKIAPTEKAANIVLVLIAMITIGILLWGSPLFKAAWAVYVLSP